MNVRKRSRKNKDPPLPSLVEVNRRLGYKLTHDTDAIDFFEAIGWHLGFSSIYKKGDEPLRSDLEAEHYQRFYQKCPGGSWELRQQSLNEAKFVAVLLRPYWRREFKSIQDLKRIIESSGLTYPGLSYETLSRFNDALQRYGLEPIKVGDSRNRKLILRLKRYGLEPSSSENR